MNFSEQIMVNEFSIRMGIFFAVFALMAIWELIAPRRIPTLSRTVRWVNNLALLALNNLVVRLIFPAAAVGVSAFAIENGWGLLNYYQLPSVAALVISVIALDFIIYLQHVLMHGLPVLWRLHRVHHADLDFDVTTGTRFHTIEIILSMLIKFAAIVVLGPPVVAVLIFEIILNATAMFNHSNIGLPRGLDRLLRLFLVTPDMHRVHHSVEDDEANSNFGFSLTWWDRLFGTYREAPRGGHCGMSIGIHNYRDPVRVSWLPGMLALPFIGKVTNYAINRRQWRGGADERQSDT